MKLYRVMPDTFCTGKELLINNNRGVENIFYQMGYMPFLNNNLKHEFNSINSKLTDEEKENGKYFFLFIDDAFINGFGLVNGFHSLDLHNFLITEYEVPVDIALKHIGYGDYTSDSAFSLTGLCVENYITKQDIEGKSILLENMNENDKRNKLLEVFTNSIPRLINYRAWYCWEQLKLYLETFFTEGTDVEFKSIEELTSKIMEKKDKIEEFLLNSKFYEQFVNLSGEIIETPFITKSIIPVSSDDNPFELAEKYEPYGKRFKDYNEKDYFKRQIIDCTIEDDKEGIKRLLRDKKYIK